jgi:hypothetical protein
MSAGMSAETRETARTIARARFVSQSLSRRCALSRHDAGNLACRSQTRSFPVKRRSTRVKSRGDLGTRIKFLVQSREPETPSISWLDPRGQRTCSRTLTSGDVRQSSRGATFHPIPLPARPERASRLRTRD